MKTRMLMAMVVVVIAAAGRVAVGQEGLITATFGNSPKCTYPNTLRADNGSVRFDLSALPKGTAISRAVVRIPLQKLKFDNILHLVPVGNSDGERLKACGPDYTRLDALAIAKAWVAGPAQNKGLAIKANNRKVDLRQAALEVTYKGAVKEALPAVTGLEADHRDGQTFLTWNEPEDVVGKDEPLFKEWEKAILEARKKRNLVYRVYRHEKPIDAATIEDAELVREIPEALSCWNRLAIQTMEFPAGTCRSPLWPGKIKIDQKVARFSIKEGKAPIPRSTGLAVISAAKAGKRYYAVSVSVDGKEGLAAFEDGKNRTTGIDEVEMKFPQFVSFRRVPPKNPKNIRQPHINVRVAWLEPPFVRKPGVSQFYFLEYAKAPKGTSQKPAPMYLYLSQYGASARVVSNPGWVSSKSALRDVFGVAFAESEDPFWAGHHESLGTLRGNEDGIVINHGQRRVLSTVAWGLALKNLDPERVYVSGQHAFWALRHGNVFAAVASNGYGNLRIGKEAKKRFKQWGPNGMGKNWLGIPHLEYLDLADWVRKNPTAELPFWVCHPSYGKFAAHTLGDLGFKPWQDFILAMVESKRAFAAVWNSNGPGELRDLLATQFPRIARNQSLPAFTNVSFNRSPKTDKPQGPITGKLKRVFEKKMDMDFVNHADRDGGINLHQRWDTASIVDEPGKWEMTLWLSKKCKEDVGTMDITPRRCRQFKAKPGESFKWQRTENGSTAQSGTVKADKHGLVTLPGVKIDKTKSRVSITR